MYTTYINVASRC